MPDLDHPSLLGSFSVASGVLLVVLLLTLGMPSSASSQLSFYQSNQGGYALVAVVALIWALVSVPFIFALGGLLRAKSRVFAQTAVALSLFGVLFYGFAIYLIVGDLISINSVTNLAPSPSESTYQAAFLYNFAFLISDPPLMAIGFAQVIFGWLAWKSRVLPNWLALIGVVGGTAGLMTLVVYQTNLLAIIQLASYAIWGLATGGLLLRPRR